MDIVSGDMVLISLFRDFSTATYDTTHTHLDRDVFSGFVVVSGTSVITAVVASTRWSQPEVRVTVPATSTALSPTPEF